MKVAVIGAGNSGCAQSIKFLKDVDCFHWPVIVKPVDSAGSKGVTKVVDKAGLKAAIETALAASISKNFIVEDFLDKVGAQSSADVFTVDGRLVY